jgi:hypothetical protein
MMELFGALKKILKGELKIDMDRGVIEYRGRRIIAIPADTAEAFVTALRRYVGDAAALVFAIEGEATGRVIREMFEWKSGTEALRGLREMAKLGGFGIISTAGGESPPCIEMTNLPIRVSQDAADIYRLHIEGFLMGLCLEPMSVAVEGAAIKACVRPLPPDECG